MLTALGITTQSTGSRGWPCSYQLVWLMHVLMLGAALMTAPACGGSKKAKPLPLRIGIAQWPGFDVFFHGRENGLFEKRGIEVTLMHFDNQHDAARAVMRGALDAAFVSSWDAHDVDHGSDSPAFILVTNVSHGADGIVARAGIASMAELRGKRVGAKLGTVNQLILLEALALHGLRPEEIEIVDMDNALAERWIYEGRLDAVVTWEPVLSKISTETGGSILYTTRDVDSLVVDGVMTRKQMIAENRESLIRLALVWFDIMHELDGHPEKVYESAAKATKIDPATFASGYAGIRRGDRDLNRRMFTEGRLPQVLAAQTEMMRAFPLGTTTARTDIIIPPDIVVAALERWRPLSAPSQGGAK